MGTLWYRVIHKSGSTGCTHFVRPFRTSPEFRTCTLSTIIIIACLGRLKSPELYSRPGEDIDNIVYSDILSLAHSDEVSMT